MALSYDLESGKVRRIAMELPSHQPGYTVASLHSGAGEHPVIGFLHDPVTAAIEWIRRGRSHQQSFVRAAAGKRNLEELLLLLHDTAVDAVAAQDSIRTASAAGK